MLRIAIKRTSTKAPILRHTRLYHYDKDIHAYRTPREFKLPSYTMEQLANRNENSKLLRLVQSFRANGHRNADLDPLSLTPKEDVPELDPEFYGISLDDTKSYNLSGILHVPSRKSDDGREQAKIPVILKQLRDTYVGRIGFEFEHIPNSSERRWLARFIESFERTTLSVEEKKHIFRFLSKSEVFDHFMSKKFPQVKRYGLEGAESMMVALDKLFHVANDAGILDIILCMPHRGRLNVLTGSLKFPASALFSKVKGNPEFPTDTPGIGDVISHISTSVDISYPSNTQKPIHISLLHNPSHLEAVNPVAMGKARARQMYLFDSKTQTPECMLGDRVMCVQMHGDAAFTGQGVVTETLGLSNLPHFTSGGSVHVIVNNQIGYTTPAMNARSTVYTSDVGKMINAPVIHVNADYPEDVTYAITLAFEYRNKFRKDVIVDLIAYRRWGHNELDEPAFTQPEMYANIRSRKSVPKLYEEKLISEGVMTQGEIDEFRNGYFKELEVELEKSYDYKPALDSLQGKWKSMIIPKTVQKECVTGVSSEILKDVGLKSVAAPSNFNLHPRLKKYHIDNRITNLSDPSGKIDWPTAEAMAFGSLLLEGYNVRISGQDVGRGTFSQRHVMLVDQSNERTIIPLNRLSPKQRGMLEIANSSLSEYAVLGFEVGVSWEHPDRLCIWEAQFGDFFNGAQIIIDTYLSSGEAKWFRQSGLVMLLPHGYDGAGPEHSSCRVERFLQLCDQKFDVLNKDVDDNPNMHVVNPTTPAQYFHVLRRQMLRKYRKPLIIVGPKILLRHPQAVSTLEDMSPSTQFQPVLPDESITDTSKVARVIFVSGKLVYDLINKRKELGLMEKMAIVRIEELCPFPLMDIQRELTKYSDAKEFYWVQEEPQNQGAYTYMEPRLSQLIPSFTVQYIGRPPLCAPASGISSRHKIDQAKILSDAFTGL